MVKVVVFFYPMRGEEMFTPISIRTFKVFSTCEASVHRSRHHETNNTDYQTEPDLAQ